MSWSSLFEGCDSWLFFDFATSTLIVLSRKQYKVISRTTLKLFICNGFMMLDVIFTSAWIIFANHDIPALICSGLIRSRLMLRILDNDCIRNVVLSSSWYTILILLEPRGVDTKWSTGSKGFFDGYHALGVVFGILLRSRKVCSIRRNVQVGSFGRSEVLRSSPTESDLKFRQQVL